MFSDNEHEHTKQNKRRKDYQQQNTLNVFLFSSRPYQWNKKEKRKIEIWNKIKTLKQKRDLTIDILESFLAEIQVFFITRSHTGNL